MLLFICLLSLYIHFFFSFSEAEACFLAQRSLTSRQFNCASRGVNVTNENQFHFGNNNVKTAQTTTKTATATTPTTIISK